MALDLTTAIAPDLAGRVLASILVSLVSIAMCAGGTVALLAWSRRPTIPVAATRRTLSGDSSTVARRKPSIDDQRGACHRARIIAPQPCIRQVQRGPDHDAVMRIGGEAPGRRAHSQERCQHHGWLRATATSDRQRRPTMSYSSGLPELALSAFSRHAAPKTPPAGTSPVVTMRHSAISSFLARATIRVLRVPPRASTVRARYHCASALSF